MATPAEIDLVEDEIAFLITKAHNSGLNSWELLDIFLRACVNLHLRATCEYYIKGGT